MKKIFLVLLMVCCFCLSGCAIQREGKLEIPTSNYEKVGYAIKGYVKENGTIILTYAHIGVDEGIIKYVYLDQIEHNPQTDRHRLTNKELGTAYGLAYKSDKGEWSVQVRAFESYIKNNNMSIDDVNAIEVYKEDEEHKKVPKPNTGLGAVCELDLTDFLEVLNTAYQNLEDTNATKLAVGETILLSEKEERLDVQLAFVGIDYRYKVCFLELETFVVESQKRGAIEPLESKVDQEGQTVQWKEQSDAFEEYVLGLNMVEVLGIETYDSGNGIDTALPKKDTDLADICNIDLKNILESIRNAGERI